MRASVLHGVRDVRMEDRPDPAPGPGQVLVRVAAVGVCGSDVHYFEHGRIGSYVVDRPLVLGHESFAHPVPDDVDLDSAALLEPVSVAVWACRKAAVTAGDRVLVTGAGPIGLIAVQVARAFGAVEIVVTDVQPERLDCSRWPRPDGPSSSAWGATRCRCPSHGSRSGS